MTKNKRISTATKKFGTGKREGHDASAFYARFSAPTVSDDQHIERCKRRNEILHGDARARASP